MNVSQLRAAALSTSAAAALLTATAPTLSRPAAAAAAAAAASNRKAGIASSVYLDTKPWKLTWMHASWAYDWTARVPAGNPGIQWVPMIWGRRYATAENIESLKLAREAGRVRYLLGFNEPDNARQANMTPAQAAELWPQLEQTGLILGSPAPDTPTDGWLARFMLLARERGLRVNFIALHYYMDFTNPDSVATMRRQLIQIHQRYHLPIWLTEVGAVNIHRWGQRMLHPGTVVRAQIFMRNVFRMLNALPFVQRYAWYTDVCPSFPGCRFSSLFTRAGAVTAEGREFRRDT